MEGTLWHGSSYPTDGNVNQEDQESDAIAAQSEVLAPPSLKIKRVDHYYSKWYKDWRYRITSSNVTAESIPVPSRGANDPWKDFSFIFVRRLSQVEGKEPTFKMIIKSEYVLKACKDVIGSWPGISWNSDPLELDPELFLTFLDEFTEYRDKLKTTAKKTSAQTYILSSVELLLSFLHTDYQATIRIINQHKTHRETTFDHLYALLVPRTLLVARCAITGSLRMFKLASWTRVVVENTSCYQLNCESVNLVDNQATGTTGVGRVVATILVKQFRGTVPIEELDVYPVKFHVEPERLKESVMRRGQKWVELIGVHHKEFDGIAAFKKDNSGFLKHTVKGRIMIDRASFKRFNANYRFPVSAMQQIAAAIPIPATIPADECGNFLPLPVPMTLNQFGNGSLVQNNRSNKADSNANKPEPTEEELLLTSTVVYGFSLSDKLWLEFDVDKISDVDWNNEAFANLVLPDDRKHLLQSLVEAHHKELGFDDFIKGKGHGLVVNFFGPPGVGKTFSAEATSEHVRRPLYLVGAGDLGTDSGTLDATLERVFEVATTWKAIVLIDEADVFLEQRSLHDLHRNAMVAVFLRHVEYYRGILFLTTNRVKAFDEAFLSRIHVALRFTHLPVESKVQIWEAFIKKLGALGEITPEQIRVLAERDINGRQIKNAARTAQSLAVGKGEKLVFRHFAETLDAMEEFTKEFENVRMVSE
ncbi:p-loop containing nucleoside triphosphate hydrolase protein [Moniliophthora roreri]|nr:p-loop containing nucleoside triphosphate hydrolase protein [Moniliophthora roreri]